LARAQAEAVGRALARLHPAVRIEFRWIESEGDQKTHVPLAQIGGKGLFTKAVEQALISGEADLAVHSFKDVPVAVNELTAGLAIAAVPRRADPRDCFICPDAAGIQDLPQGATIGTASPRRSAQLLRLRPDLQIQLLRGNIETRVRKVMVERQSHATLMAVAGLVRGGLAEHAGKPIDPSVILPSASQGALALQCRCDDHVTLTRCLPLNDAAAAAAVHAERLIVGSLNADCHSPVAVLAEPASPGATKIRIRARVLSPDGRICVEADGQATLKGLSKFARQMAQDLIARGAQRVLRGTHAPDGTAQSSSV
jgi:hydroxymethylbilane synthase